MITATASGNRIAASISGTTVSVDVKGAGTSVQASGGAGPPGATGSQTLAALTDTEIAGATEGEVLRYDGSKWKNYAEENLVDGGNF